MLPHLLLCSVLILLLSPSAAAQSSRRRTDGVPVNRSKEEMLDRAAIKHEEESYQETLERAKENARLGAELRSAFERHKTLSREDMKKLERMEKLARRVRSEVGGSSDEDGMKEPPRGLDAAFTRLAELAEEVHENVEKTSRHVVSATIIERSNELVELIRYLRKFSPR